MKVHTKKLLFNRYTAITAVLYFVTGTISWALILRVFNIYFRKAVTPIQIKARQELLQDVFRLDNYMDGFFYGVSLFLPIGVALLAMSFLDGKSGFLSLSYTRKSNYRRFIRKEILLCALGASAVMTVLYLIVFAVGVCFNKPVIAEGMGVTTAFSFILGTQRTPQLLILRYFLNVIFQGVLLPFALSLLAIAVGFITDKKYLSIITPIIYCFVCSLVMKLLRIDILNINYALGYMDIDFDRVPELYGYTSVLFVAAISTVIIEAGLRRKERLGTKA